MRCVKYFSRKQKNLIYAYLAFYNQQSAQTGRGGEMFPLVPANI